MAAYAASVKEQRKEYHAKRYVENREVILAMNAAWQKSNPEKSAARTRAWRAANVDKSRALTRMSVKKWRQENPAKSNAISRKYKLAQIRAVPAWANHFFIEEAYDLAQRRTAATGVKWHVDHIVPLRGRNVCGLHVENNLQVIPARHNLIKGNRLVEEMPC